MGTFLFLLVLAAAIAGGVYLYKKGRLTRAGLLDLVTPSTPSTPATPVSDPEPATPPVLAADPFGRGFVSRAGFDAWAAGFSNVVYLDDVKVKDGFGPAVWFVTNPNGTITRK
jgi:hypothetical protein